MMQLIETKTSGQLEIQMSGKITAQEYDTVLTPALEAALAKNDAVRLLVVIGEDLSFEIGAAWADLKLGLSHWRGFDRVAVCADNSWITNSIRAFASIMPCPVQVFASGEAEAARRWLHESLGAIHIRELGDTALQIELIGKLGAEDYALAQDNLDAKLRGRDGFGLMIDVREFDGWQGLSAMGAHFSLARGHVQLLDKAAIVGDRAWQKMAQKVGSRLVDADLQFFDAADFDAAKAWVLSD